MSGRSDLGPPQLLCCAASKQLATARDTTRPNRLHKSRTEASSAMKSTACTQRHRIRRTSASQSLNSTLHWSKLAAESNQPAIRELFQEKAKLTSTKQIQTKRKHKAERNRGDIRANDTARRSDMCSRAGHHQRLPKPNRVQINNQIVVTYSCK